MRTTTGHGSRCHVAIQYLSNQATRCFLHPGHGGRHQARISKNNPYEVITWFEGDSRQFVSENEREWPWNRRG